LNASSVNALQPARQAGNDACELRRLLPDPARTERSPRRAKFGQEQSLKAVALILEQLIAKAPEKEARHAT